MHSARSHLLQPPNLPWSSGFCMQRNLIFKEGPVAGVQKLGTCTGKWFKILAYIFINGWKTWIIYASYNQVSTFYIPGNLEWIEWSMSRNSACYPWISCYLSVNKSSELREHRDEKLRTGIKKKPWHNSQPWLKEACQIWCTGCVVCAGR